MTKRRLVLTSLGVSLLAAAGAVTYRKSTVTITSIAEMQAKLANLKLDKLTSLSGWQPFKVFAHLAQSIEYSMTGYPEMKSAAFRHTAGSAAFYAFSVAGAMTHNLTEPIPGAPAIAESGEVNAGIDMLIAALQKYENHAGDIKPHFAYGSLSKAEFAQAHVMHIENHLKLIKSTQSVA
ncbi:DUF1569 domain-containing protein [Undibacterium sp. Ji42W]|uniref:DUF1569 domain-containing protein n=1 Tax=Undibacterium sp. Ji42W TaxID=3413039 RepID=UPI003BF1DA7C